jgi:isoquinoline 1-oxidoreductase alpha subunit
MKLEVNGSTHEVDVPEDTPLLWVIREELGLTGTKFGCGKALCGACTVLVDGVARRSCVTAAGDVADRAITTVAARRSCPSRRGAGPARPGARRWRR